MIDILGDRMKTYESVSKTRLTGKIPVIIRIDGRGFSKFCKRFEKPYDEFFHNAMNNVTRTLCYNVQGCKLAERHSDEISLFLADYDTIYTTSFFDYDVQKLCSIVSGLATSSFIKELLSFQETIKNDGKNTFHYNSNYLLDYGVWPHFDTRCFSIPELDLPNYFVWRVKDSSLNSIGMHFYSMFSPNEGHGVKTHGMIEMMKSKGFDWNSLPDHIKTGTMFYRVCNTVEGEVKREWKMIPSKTNYGDIKELIELSFERGETELC